MCGFVGFINKEKNKEQTITNMMNKIIHRGPDSDGKYIDDDIAMGFRRLSIIDLAAGSQPMYNEDNSLVITFNGEIYNYQEIRKELVTKGHIFKTHCDTEVLLHGYEEYKEELLPRLRGMFAFAIWDNNKKELFAARDYFGIKPFYYGTMKDTFLYGSEIKSFLEHPDFEKELNEEALEHYLTFQYSIPNDTFFKGVYKLAPSHYLTYKDGKIKIKKYYDISFNATKDKTLEETIEAIHTTMKNSVTAHKIADVEVGSFLSSGIDSSYITCLANVDKTFTVGFDNEQYNEISYAKDLSSKIGVKNISKVITKKEYFDSLNKIQYHMDEPLADPSSIALYFVTKEAAKHVKVALSGEGADELFGGYNIYKEPLDTTFYTRIPFPIRYAIGKVASFLPKVRGINFLVRKGLKLEDRFIGNAFMFSEEERKQILNIKTSAKDFKDITKPLYDKVKNKDEVTKMQYIDINLWMVGDILLKADKMSMANSLEVRVPFLDIEVMKLASTIPTEYKVTKDFTKYALRMASKNVVPTDATNKKKLGFPVPIRVWLKEEDTYNKVEKAFLSVTAKKYFNYEYLLKLLEDHKNGERDNSRKIWTVYIFLVWYSQYFR